MNTLHKYNSQIVFLPTSSFVPTSTAKRRQEKLLFHESIIVLWLVIFLTAHLILCDGGSFF